MTAEHAWFLIRRAPNEYECARCGLIVVDFDDAASERCPGEQAESQEKKP